MATQSKQLLKDIINQCNKVLAVKPLVYISKDIKRSLGLSNLLNNYFHLSQPDDLYKDKLKNDISYLWDSKYESTHKMIESSNIIIDLLKKFNDNFSVKFFHISETEENIFQKHNIEIFNNPRKLSNKFESKIELVKIIDKNTIKIPKYQILNPHNDVEDNMQLLNDIFGSDKKLIFQKDYSNTGKGTMLVNVKELITLGNFLNNEPIKVSEYIEGIPMTINAVIYRGETIVGAPQIQILSDSSDIAPTPFTTIGNDFGLAYEILKSDKKMDKLTTFVQSIGKMMAGYKFRGMFGLDFVYHAGEFWLIEINARHTSNVSFESCLSLIEDLIPLELIDLCEWLNISFDTTILDQFRLKGAQLKLRSKVPTQVIKNTIPSGIFKMRGDRPSLEMNEINKYYGINNFVLYIDEERDISFEFIRHEISIKECGDEGVLILNLKEGSQVSYADEISTIQSNNDLTYFQNGEVKIKPWAQKLMKTIQETLT